MGPAYTWIRVKLDRDLVESPQQVVSLIAELSGMEVSDIGEAQLFDDHVRVEVREDFTDDIITAINGQKIGEHRLSAKR